MAETLGQGRSMILNKIEVHVEAIQRLLKGHGEQRNSEELRGQVGHKDSNNDKCEILSTLSTISHHIDIIHQAINKEKTDFQQILLSSGQQNMTHQAEQVCVIESDATYKGFKNSVVLRTIMQHLSTKELFNIRLVAKNWEEEATIQLLSTRVDHEVKFEWKPEDAKFHNKVGTLEKFTESYYGNQIKNFPCSHFYFESVPSPMEIAEAPADLFKFFSNHGHYIKSLCLYSLNKSAAALNILRKIIFELTPNLKSLTLMGGHIVEKEETDKPPSHKITDESKLSSEKRFTLSNLSLEHFEISWGYSVLANLVADQQWALLVQDILLSAPSIKTVSDDNLWFAKEIVSSGKTRVVHRLKWHHDPDIMPRYVEFSRAQPQLTYLEADLRFYGHENPRCNSLPTVFLVILQSTRRTLKTLKFNGRIDLLDWKLQMDFPVMENLLQFGITGWNGWSGGRGRLLPERFSLQKCFPRLKTLSIEDVGDSEFNGEMENPFKYDFNSSTTVQQLKIGVAYGQNYEFDPACLRHAQILYPNVRVLHLELYGPPSDVPRMCRGIWEFLKDSLVEELSIKLPDSESEDCAKFVDEALTGFDRKTCKMLQKQRCCRHCHGKHEFERGSSILNMKKLKLFQLIRDPDDSSRFPMHTRVSAIHAFDLMRRRQNLRIKIDVVELQEMIQDCFFSDCQENLDK